MNDEILATSVVFAGGGEMAERMRAIDWSRTPLGPVHGWSERRRTCVQLVLSSRQPMFVWCGDELINLYNDAYKSIAGGKHPASLGQPARIVWSEIWDQLGPRAEAAMRNQGTYDEALLLITERHGYPEETYCTFSFSPVPDDHGGVDGILCANTDDTQRIIGARELALLRDLASRTAGARSVERACEVAAESLETDRHDLPFAMLYLMEPGSDDLVLTATAGIDASHRAVPARFAAKAATIWPVHEALQTDGPIPVAALGTLPDLPMGAWHATPSRGAVIRLMPSAESGRPGLLVVGLNPFRQLDDRYSGFLRLVAEQISSAMASAEAYQQERQRAEALAEIDRAKIAFFGNISHEFRTPLTLMLGPTEDALAEGALSGENLRIVYRNELRLLKLVNSLLDFSRIEAGRMQASYAATDLALLTTDIASSFRAAIERAELSFAVDCPKLSQTVYIDEPMWEKLVLNLISNALKFTFAGSISVRLYALQHAAVLEVSDTGTGIPEQHLPRIFERFYRVPGTRSRTNEGTGIGLAIVHDMVRMHGGTIAVRSKLGQGTTFSVEIPLGSAHLPAERVHAERVASSTASRAALYVEEAFRWLPDGQPSAGDPPPPPGGPARRNGQKQARDTRLLIAEDNADTRDYLRRTLGAHWEVDAVSDGVAALERIAERPPNLVVTDAIMPKLDGFGLLRALQVDATLRSIPVLMVSARASEADRVAALEAGASDYVVKPFSSRELVARVDVHLRLAEQRANADRERKRFYSFLAQAPLPICVFEDSDLKIVYYNDLAKLLVGERSILNRPMLEAVPEMVGTPLAERLLHVHSMGEPEQVVDGLVALHTGDGVPIEHYMTTFLHPLRDEAGGVNGVISMGYDVTDAVATRKALELKSIEAAVATGARDDFLAMLGHELRNPLAPILTALQLIKLRGSNNFSQEHAIIQRQVEQLVRLVDDLLDVSRITRGKVSLDRTSLELSDVLARAVEMASPLIELRAHQLSVEVAAGLSLHGDASRLAQVFSNLLTNAAKFTPPSGSISMRAQREGDQIVVSVSDTGVGIRPEILPMLFDLFVQEAQPSDRLQGGLGLGLAIVRSLVTLHGGTVEARSALGSGSQFIVRLPAPEGDLPPAPQRPQSVRPAIASQVASQRVLVVDDNKDAAQCLAQLLQQLGHAVEVAYDGAAALELLQTFVPDVAILDIGLPAMDGCELARRIRKQERLSAVRLIALTGYGAAKDRLRTAEAGFEQHLLKPIDAATIHRVMEVEA